LPEVPTLYVVSSDDGVTWTDPINTMNTVHNLVTDGANFHYSHVGDAIYYRRGVAHSDGSITWGALVKAYENASVRLNDSSFIELDKDGYPFIVFSCWDAGLNNQYLYVTKSSTKDGTWNTAPNFPILLYTQGGFDGGVCLDQKCVALLSGEMVVILRGTESTYTFWRIANDGSSHTTGVSTLTTPHGGWESKLFNNLVYIVVNTSGYNYAEYDPATDTIIKEAYAFDHPSGSMEEVFDISTDGSFLFLIMSSKATIESIYYSKMTSLDDWLTPIKLIEGGNSISLRSVS
jgi:hypothetical protein